MPAYDEHFYSGMHELTMYSATEVLSILEEILPPLASVVDIGCGVGTWLSVLRRKGITRVLGIDGDWVKREMLQIPSECFMPADLAQPLRHLERFDLAISLEVAEHLPPEAARGFVESLIHLADFVLFSAAIPYQGGVNHVNLQWPAYWCAYFNSNTIRPWMRFAAESGTTRVFHGGTSRTWCCT